MPRLVVGWTIKEWQIGLLIIRSIFAFFAVVLITQEFEEQSARKVVVNTGQQPSASRVDTEAAVSRVQTKVMSIPEARSIFLAFEPGQVTGVLKVQVSNAWFNSRPHQRRQLTQMLANLWQQEMGERAAILHIYDVGPRGCGHTCVWWCVD